MPLQPNEVKTEHIANNAVITSKIAPLAVTNSQLASGSVTAEKIANASVTRAKIGDRQVITAKLRNAAVTADKLANNSVTADKIALKQITGNKLADKTITADKIADRAVTTAKIADLEVNTPDLRNGCVTAAKIADKQITGAKMIDKAITTNKLADGAVTAAKIADGQVTLSKLQEGCVSPSKLASGAVETSKIKDGAVTPAKLSFTLPPPGGDGDGITRPITPPIATDEIADASVTADKLATDSVTQTKIARNTVGWSEIREQSLEPEQIKTLSGLPPTPGQVPVYDESEGNQWWFRWADAATRPLSPQVATEEIADGAVTAEKLDPAISLGGDRFVFGTLTTPGLQSADVMYLTNISADIPYTTLDLSPWIPANAKGVLLQIGIFNQAYSTGRAFFRIRTNTEQRDALGLGNMVGSNSQVANQGIVPLVVGTDPRTIEYALESVGGPWIATFTLWVTVVGYIM